MVKYTKGYSRFFYVLCILLIASQAETEAGEGDSKADLLTALRAQSGEKYEKLLEKELSSMTMEQEKRNKKIFAQWDTKNDWLAQAVSLRRNHKTDYDAFTYLLKGEMGRLRRRASTRIFSPQLWRFLCRYIDKEKVAIWLIEQIVKKEFLAATEKNKLADWLLGGYWPHKLRMTAIKKLGVSEALMFTVMVDFQGKAYLQKTCDKYYDELSEENDPISQKRRSEFKAVLKALKGSGGKNGKNRVRVLSKDSGVN